MKKMTENYTKCSHFLPLKVEAMAVLTEKEDATLR